MQYILTFIALMWFSIGIATASTSIKITKDTPNNHMMVLIFNQLAGAIEMSTAIICLCIIWTS